MNCRSYRIRSLVLCGLFFAGLSSLVSCSGARHSAVKPPNFVGQPYIKLHSQVDGITVWIVNGPYIREKLDPEFTNFGHHLSFHFIPADEFWLDLENTPGEERFFIVHLKLEHKLMSQGMDYDSALESADAAEKKVRSLTPRAEVGRTLLASGQAPALIERIHKTLWAEYSAAIRVWIVDGELVRDLLFIDFTEGGHDEIYDFIPKNEIWIDDDVVEGERRYILLHELHERRLMAEGCDYDKAHRISSRKELWARRHPDRLETELRKEIGQMKSRISSLQSGWPEPSGPVFNHIMRLDLMISTSDT